MAATKFTAQNLDPNATTSLTWLPWTPTWSGWGSNPSGVTARYCVIRNIAFIKILATGAGTSNATTKSITNLPVACTSRQQGQIVVYDNGSWQTPTGYYDLDVGTTINFYKDVAGGLWTASGSALVLIPTFFYEI